MIDILAAWWTNNGVQFLVGSIGLTAVGVLLALPLRAPIARQRVCEAVALGVVLWLALGFVVQVLPRASMDEVSHSALTILDGPGLIVPGGMTTGVAWFDWLGVLLLAGASALALYLLFAAALLGRLLWRARPAG